ncbi:50S ribosomal protein L10 [Candidatus Nomurabacteria bacterium]|nr:50S ribosomal protein L10 [Candidatus Nomurabacteria bacterium]
MAVTKDKKKEILDKLRDVTKKDSIVFVNFHGLPVSETAAMRNELRKADVSYFVARKTLIRKAFEDSSIEGELPSLDGELALVYADDLIAPAREIFKFQKQFSDNIQMLGGVFEGKFLDKNGIEEIAQIPSRETLLGMFVNVINSPIQGFAMVVKAYADTKEA